MKRLALVLVMLFVAATVYAGGANCDMKAAKTKSVELTGKVICSDGDCEKAVFRVSDSDKSYDVCHKSKAALKSLGENGAVVRVKGKLVNCSDSEKTELVIEEAKSI